MEATETPEFAPSTAQDETLRDRLAPGKFAPVGWISPDVRISEESWLRIGATISAFERAQPWFWADWYLAGRFIHALPDDWSGPDRHTLENYASVAKRFPHSRRREHVSFKHHAELAALDEKEQDEWLDWCASNHASVPKLRAERQRRAAALLPPKPPRRIEVTKVEPQPVPVRDPPPAVVLPPPPSEVEPPPPEGEIGLPVTIFLSPELLRWARDAAAEAGVSLATFLVELIERARD
jgi:hypothetical protein